MMRSCDGLSLTKEFALHGAKIFALTKDSIERIPQDFHNAVSIRNYGKCNRSPLFDLSIFEFWESDCDSLRYYETGYISDSLELFTK